MGDRMDFLQALDAPGREYTPFPFWFLNGDLTVRELRRQLADFCAHGVYGVVLHPRIGLARRIGYLSPRFFRYIRAAVQAAEELGMRVILYDEGMYPSGSAGGLVVAGRPELASQGLALTEKPAPGDTVLCRTEAGTLVTRPSGGTIRGVHYGQDDGEPDAPPSADILNPDAVTRFLALTHDAYYRELKPWFGTVIAGFFTDEPCILGRNAAGMQPWTRGFAEVFTAAGGRLADLTALFAGQENEGTRLYRQLLRRRTGEVYYRALSAWCEAHGVALMGHPERSDDIELERYFTVPGQDLVYRWVAPETGGLREADSVQAKCSADAARLFGRRRNSNECFGACGRDGNGWHFTGGDMKWMLDWLAVRGVNLFIPHAFYYSIAGARKNERPPDVGPHSIWWPQYRQWALYMRRLSWLMTDIDLCAEAAVLCHDRDLMPQTAALLLERQIGFQYLPESVWPDCAVREGALVHHGRRYTAVFGDIAAFPDAPRPALADIAPDCRCDPPQPALRAARFRKAGRECWLLVNEGEQPLRCGLTLPVGDPVGAYDLWTGRAQRWQGRLELPRRGSLLLFACTAAEWSDLPAAPQGRTLSAPLFALEWERPERAQRGYRAQLAVSGEELAGEALWLELDGEEMIELTVNGRPAGTAFWAPQRFEIRSLLHPGQNTLEAVVTGSPANRYGTRPVWYGLRQTV